MTSMEKAFCRIAELLEEGCIDGDDILGFVRSGHEDINKWLEEKYA